LLQPLGSPASRSLYGAWHPPVTPASTPVAVARAQKQRFEINKMSSNHRFAELPPVTRGPAEH
jgi:hypothetical protein